MAEPQTPSPEAYAREAKYMEFMVRHSQDFDELIDFVPADRQDLRDTLQSVYSVEPDRLLSREKLSKLKEENKPLFDEVSTVYKSFLDIKLGFS